MEKKEPSVNKQDFYKLLTRAVQKDASDIHMKPGSPPYFRVDGELAAQGEEVVVAEDMDVVAGILLSQDQRDYFNKRGEVDLSYNERGIGRFRVNLFRQRGSVSLVMRRIKTRILTFEQLNLPPVVQRFAQMVRGLILITGTTGSGKSTTLAAIIDFINQHRRCHVVTIEDPIEYVHQDHRAVISQREVNIDTRDFSSALKAVMRQDPDVILVGEMRDLETFQAAISASETGHLVFSTLHTTNVMQTIDRIVDLFPSNQHDQVRHQLAVQLRGVMSMRLLPRADGVGRVPMCEIMFSNPGVRGLIRENRVTQLEQAILQGKEDGMQTFNDSLHSLLRRKLITNEVAMEISDNPEELNMMLQGITLSSRRGGIFK